MYINEVILYLKQNEIIYMIKYKQNKNNIDYHILVMI